METSWKRLLMWQGSNIYDLGTHHGYVFRIKNNEAIAEGARNQKTRSILLSILQIIFVIRLSKMRHKTIRHLPNK